MSLSELPFPDEEELRLDLGEDTRLQALARFDMAAQDWALACEQLRGALPPGPWRLHCRVTEDGTPYPLRTTRIRVRVWGKRRETGGWRLPAPLGRERCATCERRLQHLIHAGEIHPHALPCAACYRGGRTFFLAVLRRRSLSCDWKRAGEQLAVRVAHEQVELERLPPSDLWWRVER